MTLIKSLHFDVCGILILLIRYIVVTSVLRMSNRNLWYREFKLFDISTGFSLVSKFVGIKLRKFKNFLADLIAWTIQDDSLNSCKKILLQKVFYHKRM